MGLSRAGLYVVQLFSLDDRDSSGGQHREQTRRAYFQDPYNLANVSSTFYMSNNFYVKATFTAAYTSQVIVEQLPGWPNGFTDVGDGNLEALVVRDVSTTPGIQYQPVSTTRYLGEPAAFRATIYGPAPMGYQWQRDSGTGFTNLASSGVLNSSAPTAVSYAIPAVAMADAASYRLVVTNSSGGTTSQVATLTVLALPAAGTHDRAVLSYGPLAYWEFNEPALSTAAYDYVGGFNGAYQPNCTNGVPGLPVSFGGLSSGEFAVECVYGYTNSGVILPALNFPATNTITWTAWIYPSSINGGSTTYTQAAWTGLITTRSSTYASGMNYNDQGMLGYTWNQNNGNTYGFVSQLTIPDNEWSFVAVALSATNAALYLINVQGFQMTNNPIAHDTETWNGAATIGYDAVGGATPYSRNFNGVIDNVAVFTHTLSMADIQNLHAAIPLAPPAAAPIGLTATAGDAQVSLSWNAVTGATSYNVKRSTTPGGPYTTVGSSAGAPFIDTGVANGTLYYYVVSAANAAGESPNSTEASARPTSAATPRMVVGISGSNLHLTWPVGNTGWLLQGQTNAPGVGISTNWVAVPGSDGSNDVLIPIDQPAGSAFFRLIHP